MSKPIKVVVVVVVFVCFIQDIIQLVLRIIMSQQLLAHQDFVVSEEGHLDMVVTEVMDFNRFSINMRTDYTLEAREKLMNCMDLF